MHASPKLKVYIRLLFLLAIAILPFEAVLFFVPGSFGSAITNTVDSVKILDLTNKSRLAQNLAPLKISPKLEKAAIMKASDMLNRGYFSHSSPEGADFTKNIKIQKYYYLEAGENMAMDFTTSEAVVEGWMKSDAHKRNILNPRFKDIGIAVLTGQYNGVETTVVVQIFGNPTKYAK